MLVAHLVFRFDTGGLEEVVLATVSDQREGIRHVVISLTEASEFYRKRLPPEVAVHTLGKAPGIDPAMWFRAMRLLRRLRPDILQTYNLPCLEVQFVAALCGIRTRFHAEHGRSAVDPAGVNPRHLKLRRAARYVVNRWIVVSADLETWARDVVGVSANSIEFVRNGIDTDRFTPPNFSAKTSARALLPKPFCDAEIVVGSIGRLDPVKNQHWLLESWAELRRSDPDLINRFALVLVGGGALEASLRESAHRLGLDDRVWLTGNYEHVEKLLPAFDLFVLASVAEGTPMTVLEAMACALPVVATSVGGLPEIVDADVGALFQPGDVGGLLVSLDRFANEGERRRCGANARQLVELQFSDQKMLDHYAALYTGSVGVNPAASSH